MSLAQIYLLHFNLRFPTTASFEKIHPIFCVCLAALYPLTLSEIYYSVNSLYTDCFVSWEEFMQNFKVKLILLNLIIFNIFMIKIEIIIFFSPCLSYV